MTPGRAAARAAALLLALSAPVARAAPPEPPDPAAVDAATRRAIAWLLGCQEADGSWRGADLPRYRGGTALVIHALLKAGVDPGHAAIRAGASWAERQPLERTYDVAVTLQMLAALGGTPRRDLAEALHEQLVVTVGNGSGSTPGLWGYPFAFSGEPDPSYTDLSNTQYALLGLRAARSLGLETPPALYRRVARSVLERMGDYGGFSYRPGHAETGSMTAAGLSSLLLCAEGLGGSAGDRALAGRLRRAASLAESWFEKHISFRENPAFPRDAQPGAQRWFFYYLYGLERVGALAGRATIGGRDWYTEGSREVLRRQNADGSFATAWGEVEVNTAFALLFLVRATAQTGKPPVRRRAVTSGEDGPFVVLIDPSCPMTLSAVAFGAEVRERLRRGFRVEALDWLVDGALAAAVAPTDPSLERERFAARVPCPRNGTVEVEARLRLRAADGSEETVRVGPVRVEIDGALDRKRRLALRDGGRNLLLGAAVRAEATSERGFEGRAERAVDDYCATSWWCEEEDERPRLRIETKRAVRAGVLSLVVGHGSLNGAADRARPRRVSVRLNRGRPREVLLFDAPDVEQRVRFPETRVRRVDLRVLDVLPGRVDRRSCGFAEVKLLPADTPHESDPLVSAERRQAIPIHRARVTYDDPGARFADPDFDDGGWEEGAPDLVAPLEGWGEERDFLEPRAWWRARVDLGELADAVVVEAFVDDSAVLYWNGREIGRVAKWTRGWFRPFVVPKDLLRRGRNVLAASVSDIGGSRRLRLRATAVFLPQEPSPR